MTEAPSPKKVSFVASTIAKLAQSRFLAASLAIHVFLLISVGTVVLFKVAQPQEAFIAVGGSGDLLAQDEPEMESSDAPSTEEFEEPAVEPSENLSPTSTQASAISALTDTASASWSTSAPVAYQSMGQTLSSARPLSTGKASSVGTTSKLGSASKTRGSLFGTQIEAAKLGVIVDVSGSAHGYLEDAFKQIDRSFPDAVLVLYNGCGLVGKLNPADFTIVARKEAASLFNKSEKDPKSIFAVIELAKKRNPDLDRSLAKVLKRDTTFLLSASPNAKGPNLATRFAFDKLIAEGVDTIYWFADFADDISKAECQDVAAILHAKGIKLVIHNFSGRPARPVLAEVVSQTGGAVILQVPRN